MALQVNSEQRPVLFLLQHSSSLPGEGVWGWDTLWLFGCVPESLPEPLTATGTRMRDGKKINSVLRELL